MISSPDLLTIAADFTSRIPGDDPYEAERNACWLHIGQARMKLDRLESALDALNLLTERESQAQLRLAIIHWSADHLESAAARNVVRDTVHHIERWEGVLSRKDFSDMVLPIYKILGEASVRSMSEKIADSFTAGNVLVELAALLGDRAKCHETLRAAEELAVRSRDRDYALRRVILGYQRAGLEEDERRARGLMSQDLEEMNRFMDTVGEEVGKALRPLDPPEPDSTAMRLQRILDYGYNDLRVMFLSEFSAAGGLDDPEAERLINTAAFRRIAPPRPPSIESDPSSFDLETLATSLFGRPIRQRESDRPLVDGSGFLEVSDPNRFITTVQNLLQGFGQIAPRFSPAQIEQGLWYLFAYPFWLSQLLTEEIPPAQVTALTHAMYYPFRDYYLPMADNYAGSAFFMWWDNFNSGGHNPAMDEACVEVLGRILRLPHKECRDAALHGLNHLFPNPRAAEVIQRYLDENRGAMSEEEIEWAQLCKRGGAT
jgi:hypothetical protein